jgi:hypothetical protein
MKQFPPKKSNTNPIGYNTMPPTKTSYDVAFVTTTQTQMGD